MIAVSALVTANNDVTAIRSRANDTAINHTKQLLWRLTGFTAVHIATLYPYALLKIYIQ